MRKGLMAPRIRALALVKMAPGAAGKRVNG